jgi:hypothetical protein
VAATLTGLDTAVYTLDEVRLGPSAGLATGMAGVMGFDRFTSDRSTVLTGPGAGTSAAAPGGGSGLRGSGGYAGRDGYGGDGSGGRERAMDRPAADGPRGR